MIKRDIIDTSKERKSKQPGLQTDVKVGRCDRPEYEKSSLLASKTENF